MKDLPGEPLGEKVTRGTMFFFGGSHGKFRGVKIIYERVLYPSLGSNNITHCIPFTKYGHSKESMIF